MFKYKASTSKKQLNKKDIGSPHPAEVTENSVAVQALLRGDDNAIENYRSLLSWKSLPSKFKVVHSLRIDRYINSQLLRENADKCFSEWDAISTSVINESDKVVSRYLDSRGRSLSSSNAITLGEIAFVLEFSPSNIIGTFPHDVYFDNHAGMQVGAGASQSIESKAALSNAILKGIPKNNEIVNLPKRTYLHVRPYLAIIRDQRSNPNSHYSEVIITGREGVYIHPGMPKTKAIKVKEVLVMPEGEIEWHNGSPVLKENLRLALETI